MSELRVFAIGQKRMWPVWGRLGMGWRITQQRKMGLHGDLGQLPSRVSLNSWWGGLGSWTWFRLWFYSRVDCILRASELFSSGLWCIPSPEFNLPRSSFCYHYKTRSYKNPSGITVERSPTWVDPTTICLHRPGSWRGQTWINTTPGRAVPALLRCATPYQQEGNVSLETSLENCSIHFLLGSVFSFKSLSRHVETNMSMLSPLNHS